MPIKFLNDVAVDTSVLYVDTVNDRVGIGTTSPAYPLDIQSSSTVALRLNNSSNSSCIIKTDNTYLSLQSAGYILASNPILAYEGLWLLNNKFIRSQESNGTWKDILVLDSSNVLKVGTLGNVSSGGDVAFLVSGSEKMRIDSSGNVGIGTTSPTNGKLVIDSTANQIAIETGTAGDGRLNIGHFSNGTFIGTYGDDGGAADIIRFGTHSGDERMRITSAGNVGIGTTSPSSLLHLVSNAPTISGTSTNNSSGLRYNTVGTAGDTHRFQYNGTTQLNIKNSGNVGIGTTSPSQKLHVSGNLRVTGAYYDSNNSSGTANQVLVSTATGTDWVDGSGSSIIGGPYLPLAGGTITGNLTVNGTVNIGNQLTFPYGSIGDYIYHTGDGDTFYGFPANDTFIVATSATERMRIDSAGNIGIGTTSPSEKLHVVGNTKIEGVVIVNSANSSLYIGSSNTGQSSTSTGDRNVVIGPSAFRSNTSARYNTAVGHAAMQDTTTGDYNSVLGNQALSDNIDGDYNVAVGNQTMAFTTNSSNNTAVGYRALYQAQSGSNTGIGQGALNSLQSSTSSGDNTGIGQGVLNKITSGQRNVGVGNAAGQKYGGTNNDVVTANDSVFIGADSDAGGDNQTNQIVIGYNAIGLGSNTAVLGNDSIATTQLKGNVGIGTTSPSAKLHVEGDGSIIRLQNNNSDANGTFIDFIDSTGTRTGYVGTTGTSDDMFLYTQGAKPIRFYTNATEKMRIDSAGNVGIGTTLPSSPLMFGKSVYGNFDSENFYRIKLQDQGGTHNDVGIGQTASGNMGFNITSGSAFIFNNGTSGEIARFDGTGLGIGTTSPTEKLHVAGSARVTGAYYDSNNSPGTSGQVLSSTATGTDWIDGSAIPGLVDGTGTANYVARWIGTESIGTGVLYDNGSNVGISATSLYSKLHIGNSSNGNNNLLTMESSGSVWVHLKTPSSNQAQIGFGDTQFVNQNTRGRIVYNSSTTTANNYMSFVTNFAEVMRITNSSVGIGTTSPQEKLHVYNGSAYITPIVYAANQNDWVIRAGAYNNTSFDQGLKLKSSSTGASYMAFETTGNTETMVLRNGNVGIGTDSPGAKLTVVDDILLTGSSPSLTLTDASSSFVIKTNTAGEGIVQTSGTSKPIRFFRNNGSNESMRIDGTGNVGIGTTSPQEKLHVQNYTTGESHQAMFKGGAVTIGDYSYISLNNGYGAEYNKEVRLAAVAELSTSNKTGFAILTSPDANGASGHERLRVTADGNVGIGTTDPNAKLDIFNAGGNATSLSLVQTYSGLTVKPYSAVDSKLTFSANSGNTQIIQATNNTSTTGRQIALQPFGGNVGIGTTSPGSKLHVSGGDIELDDGYEVKFNINGTVTADEELVLDAGTTDSKIILDGSDSAMQFITGNSTAIAINDAQNVGIGTTSPSFQLQLSTNSAAKPTSSSWTIVSDERVKTNIRPYETGLDKLLQIEPKLFDYNGKAGFDTKAKNNIGVIAQEIKDIMPETVKKYNAKLNEKDEEDTELYNFDSHALTFALINSVKELNAKIENLETKIQTLENQ